MNRLRRRTRGILERAWARLMRAAGQDWRMHQELRRYFELRTHEQLRHDRADIADIVTALVFVLETLERSEISSTADAARKHLKSVLQARQNQFGTDWVFSARSDLPPIEKKDHHAPRRTYGN